MKSDRVFLCEWLGDTTDSYNDIPWPMVHEWAGYDCIRWINGQNVNRVQMVLEKDQGVNSGFHRLYAEFLDPTARTEFALKFAK